MIVITFEDHPIITEVQIISTPYESNDICIAFKNGIQNSTLEKYIYDLRKILRLSVEKIDGKYLIKNMIDPRALLGVCLMAGNKWSVPMSDLVRHTSNLAKVLEKRQKLRDQLVEQQESLLISSAKDYVNVIILNSPSYKVAAIFLHACFANLSGTEKGLEVLQEQVNIAGLNGSYFHAVIKLTAILNGRANLEDVFLESGFIPVLSLQRSVLQNLIILNLKEKFSTLKDSELFAMYAHSQLSAQGYNFPSFSPEMEKLVSDAFSTINSNRDDIKNVINSSLELMGLLSFSFMPDINRIDNLRSHFKSIVFDDVMLDIQNSLQDQQAKIDNLLFQALLANDLNRVQMALVELQYTINDKLPDGRTPLIMSIQQCSANIVIEILSHKPDLNITYQGEDAFTIALKIPRPDIVELLISAGVDFFELTLPGRPRCVQARPIGSYPDTFMPLMPAVMYSPDVSPFAFAFEKVDEQGSNSKYVAVVNILLRNGAGISRYFTPEEADLLHSRDVTLEATGGVKSILTFDDFVERIEPNEFEFWKNILVKAKRKYPNNVELEKVLQFLMLFDDKKLNDSDEVINSFKVICNIINQFNNQHKIYNHKDRSETLAKNDFDEMINILNGCINELHKLNIRYLNVLRDKPAFVHIERRIQSFRDLLVNRNRFTLLDKRLDEDEGNYIGNRDLTYRVFGYLQNNDLKKCVSVCSTWFSLLKIPTVNNQILKQLVNNKKLSLRCALILERAKLPHLEFNLSNVKTDASLIDKLILVDRIPLVMFRKLGFRISVADLDDYSENIKKLFKMTKDPKIFESIENPCMKHLMMYPNNVLQALQENGLFLDDLILNSEALKSYENAYLDGPDTCSKSQWIEILSTKIRSFKSCP